MSIEPRRSHLADSRRISPAAPAAASSIAPSELRLLRRTCLVRPLRGDLALVSELVRHLSAEMPEIDFHLRPTEPPEVLWVTGAREHNGADVTRLRAGYPEAWLVVSGRGLEGPAVEPLRSGGADRVLGWPVPVQVLRAALLGRGRGI